MCGYTIPLEPILSKIADNIHKRSPRATRLCAKHRASAEAEVRGNALHTTQYFQKDVVCRNANAERERNLRNAGGLGESISQNSLRVLPDFLAGFWRDGH